MPRMTFSDTIKGFSARKLVRNDISYIAIRSLVKMLYFHDDHFWPSCGD